MSNYGRPEWLDRMPVKGNGERRTLPPAPPVEVVQHRAPVEVGREVARQVRAPSAATQSVRYYNPGKAQAPDWNAAQAFRIANNTVLSCIDRIGNYLSKCPFHVGADPEKHEDYDINAPLARLLGPPPGGPNPSTSARDLWKWTVGQWVLSGRFGWELELGASDVPVALWPLPTSSLLPVPSSSGVYYFTGFEYGPINNRKTLPRERVLYHWRSAMDDWRQPDPPLRAAYLDTMIAVAQSQYDYAFLRNDARPATLIVTEEFADEDDKRAFEQQWNSSYAGPENAGKVVVVEADGGGNGVTGAIDVQVIGVTPKDAQAAQRYSDRIQQIAIALGVPWSILDASGRTFDNASQEWANFVHGTLEPLACGFADAINMQLAPRFGPNVGWFDLDDLIPGKAVNPVTAQVGAPALVQAQLMTVNEARADYGLPPLPDGDRVMTTDEIAALKAGPPVQAFSAAPEVREVSTPATALVPVEPPAPLPEDRGETAEELEARRTKVWNATDSKVRALEQAFEEDMARLFRRQAKSVLARLEHKRARRNQSEVRALADEVFDPEHWLEETVDETRRLYRNIALAAGGAMADRFGIAFDLDAPFVQRFIAERANQLAGNVTDTTYHAIQDALAEGVGEGESIPDLAKRIEHVFEVATKSRATMIARTETISAFNGAGTEVAQEAGTDVVAGQEWLATRDARTRDQHAERDGEVVQIGEPFSGGLMYPGDPSGDPGDVINCRCTVVYLTPEEMSSRGAARSVPLSTARAVMALVRVGAFDERAVRSFAGAAA